MQQVRKIYEELHLNIYRYASFIFQLLVNERHWSATERPQLTYEHRFESLFSHLTEMTCQQKQLIHLSSHTMPAKLNETKTEIRSTRFEPLDRHSVITADRMAYSVLCTFKNDYLDFCETFLMWSSFVSQLSCFLQSFGSHLDVYLFNTPFRFQSLNKLLVCFSVLAILYYVSSRGMMSIDKKSHHFKQ